MKEIDFLPAEFHHRRALQRYQWYLSGIGTVVVLVLLWNILDQSRQGNVLRAQLVNLENEHTDVLAQLVELKRLQKKRNEMASYATFGSLLRAHPSFSDVLLAMASGCPERITLERIQLRQVNLPGQSSNRSLGRSSAPEELRHAEQLEQFTKERNQARWRLTLEGVAETDLAVFDLSEKLQTTDRFEHVRLISSTDSQKVGRAILRRFTIECQLRHVL